MVQVNATDQDFDGKSHLEYAIAEGNEGGKFSIDPRSGLITVASPEGFSAMHRLKVTVSDGQFSSSCAVWVAVRELPHAGLSFAVDKYFAGVEENSSRVDTVVMVHVHGSELNEHLHFHILNPSDMFEIGETSGVIQTRGIPFDREEKDNYLLIVEVRTH